MYRRTSSLNRSRGHWREEQMSANAVRTYQESQSPTPRKPKYRPTDAQQAAFAAFMKGGMESLTQEQKTLLAAHMWLAPSQRETFAQAAAQ